jgi:hypothetical protein
MIGLAAAACSGGAGVTAEVTRPAAARGDRRRTQVVAA